MGRRLLDVLREALEGAPEVGTVYQVVQLSERGHPKDALVVHMTDGSIYHVQAREVLS